MANTVNDVMNVIASPDYGIKSIAGTTHEILAILQGTHNSQNNIHNIVDDVKNLLQSLVESSSQKVKPIEIGDKSTKISHKHIQDILDETKSIRKAIISLEKAIVKQGGQNIAVAKLSDKASEKVAEAMAKNIEKQKTGSGMSILVDAFNKLKNISLKDIIFGNIKLKKISKLFKDAKENLKINEKDINAIIKLINATPEMIKSLWKISWKINYIIKKDTIKKLRDIFVGKSSLLSIAQLLQKNKKIFNKAATVIKDIKELILSLNKVIKKLFFVSLWAKATSNGVKIIESTINKLISLTKKLTKNKKEISNGVKVAKKITTLVGNLLIASIFLTISVITGGPAILGAILLNKMVDILIPITKKLSNNKKHIRKAIGSALMLIAFTGLMAASSLLLATIAVTGVPALLGSIFMLGIVAICTLTFKMLKKASKNVLIGSLVMLLMSTSLILFGIALKKITDATKDVSWKQFGMIAAFIGLFAVTIGVMGIVPIAAAIAIGSVVMIVMSISLMFFGNALKKISKATENLESKHISLIADSMWSLAWGISKLSVLLIPITLGAATLSAMILPLYAFVKTLKIINDIKTIPTKEVEQLLNVMKLIGDFYKSNALKPKILRIARRYKRMMRPFGKTLKSLAKLKKLGTIPMDLLSQTLNAMNVIANHYIQNPIEKKDIKQAKRYKRMLRPFGKTLKSLAKLKELGTIPMGLVMQTLNAMNVIANHYIQNPIEKKDIKQARRYKRMMRPFGKTIKHLAKLKELGTIPMGLVMQTLNAMNVIANYYKNNPIEKKDIKQARKYKRMLRPFGKTLEYFTKLKELGTIPMGLVMQTLNAMNVIANYYKNNPIERKAIKQARRYKRMLRPFSKTIKHLAKLKELGIIPMGLVMQTLNAMSTIANYYKNNPIERKAIKQARRYKRMLRPFGKTLEYFTKLKELGTIPMGLVMQTLDTMSTIASFYSTTNLRYNIRLKSKCVEYIVEKFTNTATYIKNRFENFTESNYNNVNFAVKSMEEILNLFKYHSLNKEQIEISHANIAILKDMISTMSDISNLNSTTISDVGNAMSNTLNEVNTVDISKVKSVTNMLNAFNGINKSKNVIDKFTESVKEFTSSCKNLMDAMRENTDAINNIDDNNMGSSIISEVRENNIIGQSNDIMSVNSSVRIANVDEIAKNIAEKINGVLSVDVPDTQVQLLINGYGGNEWTITRY